MATLLFIINTYKLLQIKLNSFLGAISIIGSQHVQSCVGIESVAQAVKDAKETARINNIYNCDFIEGNVEIVNISIIYKL